MRMREAVHMFTAVVVVVLLGLAQTAPVAAAWTYVQVRLYMKGSTSVKLTEVTITGVNQKGEHPTWRWSGSASEVKTTNSWWGDTETLRVDLKLSNGISRHCDVSLNNYPWISTQSMAVDPNTGNIQSFSSGTPSPRCG